MFLRFYPPQPALTSFIKGYQIIHVQTPHEQPLPVCPFPPHAVQHLDFYPRAPVQVLHTRTQQTNSSPGCIIVGLKSRAWT